MRRAIDVSAQVALAFLFVWAMVRYPVIQVLVGIVLAGAIINYWRSRRKGIRLTNLHHYDMEKSKIWIAELHSQSKDPAKPAAFRAAAQHLIPYARHMFCTKRNEWRHKEISFRMGAAGKPISWLVYAGTPSQLRKVIERFWCWLVINEMRKEQARILRANKRITEIVQGLTPTVNVFLRAVCIPASDSPPDVGGRALPAVFELAQLRSEEDILCHLDLQPEEIKVYGKICKKQNVNLDYTLTDAQLVAVMLDKQYKAPKRAIARLLGLRRSSLRSRLDDANRRIQRQEGVRHPRRNKGGRQSDKDNLGEPC